MFTEIVRVKITKGAYIGQVVPLLIEKSQKENKIVVFRFSSPKDIEVFPFSTVDEIMNEIREEANFFSYGESPAVTMLPLTKKINQLEESVKNLTELNETQKKCYETEIAILKQVINILTRK